MRKWKWILSFAFVLMLLTTCTAQKTVDQKILGEWKLIRIEFIDRSIATQDTINFVSKYITNNLRIRFDTDKRYRHFSKGKERDANDKIIFKIVDKNFVPSSDGTLIDFDLYNSDGSLYEGTNKPGPFEIIKIMESELVLRKLELRYQIIRQGGNMDNDLQRMIEQHENLLFIYNRI